MKNLQMALSGVLALQLVLAAGLFWNTSARNQAQAQQTQLVQTKTDALKRLEIAGDDERVTLVKKDGQWQLPDLHDLPVDSDKLDTLLAKLTALKGNWPVATSNSARERFEVAEDKFRKHLKLYTTDGDTPTAELLVGTSPGFRKVHVRRADDDAIYAVELNSFDLPENAGSWLDKTLLAAGDIERIEGPDYQLRKNGDNWKFATANSDGKEIVVPAVDPGKSRELASALEKLRVTSPAEEIPDVEETEIVVQSERGELRYHFAQADNKYYVRRNDREQVFEIAKYDFERVVNKRHDDLVLVEREEKEQTAEGEEQEDTEDPAA
ncbi:DUF4340 domain-containing protein [Microbulbifer hydrolyticus]|uniref:DUF4340 domain-containing protein n=1 Tax=Microbulbifer hydrolyticus TaxID=48074 RepID=A0A6P1T5R6_9GAMM|nr:DUF4340 domain-containing protein [Microbulbifer hydrolyticus]MBB5211141.1 hypothetical protein [Microbulbifer hydrolyticus]QHQ38078.1 DUF4340 domain-containing protein [Microbulbifer hydrolyticus]